VYPISSGPRWIAARTPPTRWVALEGALVALAIPGMLARTLAMSAIVPNPKSIRGFRNPQAFEAWVSANHDRREELWLRIYKKDSGVPTVTYAEALDVALCWGWIDGIRKGLDDKSFLQRFTPRRAKSIWSQNNRAHVARLIAAGRMTPHGQKHIDAAKSDGRWEAAYAPSRTLTATDLPADLRAAIDASPRARRAFAGLGKTDLFALAFRTNNAKTAEGRKRKIAALVATLAKGEPIARRAFSPATAKDNARGGQR
jgi:uncharacterized protein YdeI (YjbR/CyaY-like superfamily)